MMFLSLQELNWDFYFFAIAVVFFNTFGKVIY